MRKVCVPHDKVCCSSVRNPVAMEPRFCNNCQLTILHEVSYNTDGLGEWKYYECISCATEVKVKKLLSR
jgi:hypothetical protein